MTPSEAPVIEIRCAIGCRRKAPSTEVFLSGKGIVSILNREIEDIFWQCPLSRRPQRVKCRKRLRCYCREGESL